jgi:TolB-like protein
VTTAPSTLFGSLQAALGSQYRLEREIGAGGMGVVFLATDTTLDRTVAVKVVHPELAVHPSISQRFLSEARMIAKLRHPNIVAVHAAGEATGVLYYVMDHVPGESLRQRLQREGKIAPAVAERIIADLADALDAAGQAGLVHRDVKPENVLLDANTGRALLADFGIARAMGGDGVAGITGQGLAVGTPTYMSPEQAGGEAVDTRSDLYSLGVVGYEMVTGQAPFRAASSATVATMHLAEPPVPVEQLCPDLPAPLAATIMRALAKQPADRWQSGAEMRAALGSAVIHSPVPVRAAALRSRNRLRLGLAVAGLLSVVAVAWAMTRPAGPGRGVNPRHSVVVLPFDNVRREPDVDWLREGSVNMLTLTLSQWNDLTVVDHERLHDVLVRAGYQPGEPLGLDLARRVARAAGVWTVVLGDFTRAGDSLYLSARMFDVATGKRLDVATVADRYTDDVRPLFDRLATNLLNLAGAPSGVRADVAQRTTGSLEAYRAYLAGIEELNQWNLSSAERDLSRAVALDSTFALAYYKLALTRGWMFGQFDSLGHESIVKASRNRARLTDHDQVMVQAYQAFVEGDYAGSRNQYQALLARDTTDADAWYALGDAWFHDPDTASNNYARHNQEALRAFHRAIDYDPGYYLAYEHTTWILQNASRPKPPWALLAGDSLAPVYGPGDRRLLDSTAVAPSIRLARAQGLREARAWLSSQPDNPHSQGALIEQLYASGDYTAALAEVERIRGGPHGAKRDDLPFVRGRVHLASGDIPAAAVAVRAATDSADVEDFDPGSMPSLIEREVLAGVNSLAYLGQAEQASEVIDLASGIDERWYVKPGAIYVANRSGAHALYEGHLYAALGVPTVDLRRLWQAVADAAREAPAAQRPSVLALGWPAALGLFIGQTGDESALKEFGAMGGGSFPNEVQALQALSRRDTVGARRLLAAKDTSTGVEWKMRPFWKGYRDYVRALAYYQLGDYTRSVQQLESFQTANLETESFDVRWGLMGRARLLRAESLEKLGRPTDARHEYEAVLGEYDAADRSLAPYLDQARLGLARVAGTG